MVVVLGLAACGGGGGGGIVVTGTGTVPATTTTATVTTVVTATTTTVTTATSTTGLLLTGIAYPLAANNSVHVPVGTMIAASNGTVTTVNAASSSLNVPAGSVVTVPATATGAANILVTTLASLPYSFTTTLPTVTLLAGSPTSSGPPADGTGTGAVFWGGGHLAADGAGNVLVSDGGALRQVSPAGVVTTVVTAYTPYDWEGIAVNAAGTVYGSGTSYAPPPDNYGASIQTLSTTGAYTTVVSNWTKSATVSALGYGGLAVDGSGTMFLTDAANHRVLKFTAAGVMSVFAGGTASGSVDGVGTAARFNNPSDLAIDAAGNLFVSDTGNGAVRKITPGGTVTTVTRQTSPGAIAASAAGVVYFIAGSPKTLFRLSQDLSVSVAYPLAGVTDAISGLAVDSAGNVYAGTFGIGAQIFKITF